jgi:hypothetical protein
VRYEAATTAPNVSTLFLPLVLLVISLLLARGGPTLSWFPQPIGSMIVTGQLTDLDGGEGSRIHASCITRNYFNVHIACSTKRGPSSEISP